MHAAEAAVFLTQYAGHGRLLCTQICLRNSIRRACSRLEFNVIVVIGGDGTFSECINGILEAGKSSRLLVGLYPAGRVGLGSRAPIGSGNDYYRSVFGGSRIPAFEEYIRCILSGAMQGKRVYVGMVEVNRTCLTLGD